MSFVNIHTKQGPGMFIFNIRVYTPANDPTNISLIFSEVLLATHKYLMFWQDLNINHSFNIE